MSDMPTTRESLVLKIRDETDQQAWAEFTEIYQPALYRFVRRRGFQHADALEVTQEVLMAVASAVDRYEIDETRGRFRHWLSVIAKNTAINYFDRQRRHPRATGDSHIERLLATEEFAGSCSAAFGLEYRRRVFRWAAERVRPTFQEKTWRAFWLTAVENRPVAEVGRELSLSIGAIHAARSRVMARLRRTVARFDDESMSDETAI